MGVTVNEVLDDIECILASADDSDDSDVADGTIDHVLGQLVGYIQGVRRMMPDGPVPEKTETGTEPE